MDGAMNTATPPATAPKDHMALAVISIICGFPPFGIVATIHANRVASHRLAGNMALATTASRKALRWSIASLVAIPLLGVVLIGYGLLLRVAG
jgi:hypothetical protein